MKRIILSVIMASLAGGLWAQGEMDALNMSRTDFIGTARYTGMSGAFGAIGGDASAMKTNPAGLGIYRRSEISASVLGQQTVAKDNVGKRGGAALGHASFVLNFGGKSESNFISSLGLNYQRNSLVRSHRGMFADALPASVSDYMADVTNRNNIMLQDINVELSKAFDGSVPFISDLAWQTGMINPMDWENPRGTTYQSLLSPGEATSSVLDVVERGGAHEFDIAYGCNIKNIVFLGASMNFQWINQRHESYYREEFEGGGYYDILNSLHTRGWGANFKIGAIVAPTDFFRIGFSVHTPTMLKIDETSYFDVQYDTGVETNGAFNRRDIVEYNYRSPYKIVGSLGFILGRRAVLSADYEMTDLATMGFKPARNPDHYRMDSYDNPYYVVNQRINNDFRKQHTLRIGAEFRATEEFSVRLGVGYKSAPVKDELENGSRPIYTAGTITNYVIPKSMKNASVGLGFHKSFFSIDVAYAFCMQNMKQYAFYDVTGQVSPLKMTEFRHNIVTTLGFRF